MKTPELFEGSSKEIVLSPDQKEQIAALEIALEHESLIVEEEIRSGGLASTWWEKNHDAIDRAIGDVFQA